MALYTLYNEYQSPPSEDTQFYGCAEPTTTSTVTDLKILGGTHDVTYSYVKFVANTNTSTVLMKITSSQDADIHDIVFDHCIFSTMSASRQGDNFHMLNYSLTGKVVYNITFTNCWFEPNSRMSLEMNGRGGWWHDVTIDHCTFEGGLGEVLSFDMSPGDYPAVSPWGVNVGGVVRGVEGLTITNNLIEGTGAPDVNGYTQPNPDGGFYNWRRGLEFCCIFPYASNNALGRSEFSRNKVGRCLEGWYQTNYGSISYMTMADNIFDDSYNDHLCPSHAGTAISGNTARSVHDCTFTGNTYRLGTSHSTIFLSGYNGTDNAYSGERWYSDRSSLTADFNFTDSTFEDCDFYLPSSVTLASGSTYDTACYFKNGHTGGAPA